MVAASLQRSEAFKEPARVPQGIVRPFLQHLEATVRSITGEWGGVGGQGAAGRNTSFGRPN